MVFEFDMEEVLEVEHTLGKASRRPKDENAPKRYLSAFFLWANSKRPALLKSGSSVTEVGKQLGSMWKDVSASEKKKLEVQVAKDKKVYEAKVEKYKKSANYKKHQIKLHAWKIHETKKPFPRGSNAPKKAMTAYMLFSHSVRSEILEENPDIEISEIMKEQAIRWKALSEKDRKPWIEKGLTEKKKYETKVARYMKTSDYLTWAEGRDKYKSEMLDKRNKLMGIKKRARSTKKPKDSKSPSKKKQKKKSKSRSASRKKSSRRSKARKASKKRRSPSSSRSTSRSSSRSSRSRTPKASKKKSRRAGRRRTSKSRSKSKSRRRSVKRKAVRRRRKARKSKKPVSE